MPLVLCLSYFSFLFLNFVNEGETKTRRRRHELGTGGMQHACREALERCRSAGPRGATCRTCCCCWTRRLLLRSETHAESPKTSRAVPHARRARRARRSSRPIPAMICGPDSSRGREGEVGRGRGPPRGRGPGWGLPRHQSARRLALRAPLRALGVLMKAMGLMAAALGASARPSARRCAPRKLEARARCARLAAYGLPNFSRHFLKASPLPPHTLCNTCPYPPNIEVAPLLGLISMQGAGRIHGAHRVVWVPGE